MTVPRPTHSKKAVVVSESELLLVDEPVSAKLCSVSVGTFRKWVALGLIERVPVPGNVRRNLYLRREIEEFVDRLARRA